MDVVIRAAVVFVILGLAIRLTGKRQIAQLSAFDLILLVTMGDLVGQTVMQEDYSLTAGFLSVATFAVLSMAVSLTMYFWRGSRSVLGGTATILMRDGRLDEAIMRSEQVTMDDLREAGRQAGIRDLREVDIAVLETDGSFSFFTRQGGGAHATQSGPDKLA